MIKYKNKNVFIEMFTGLFDSFKYYRLNHDWEKDGDNYGPDGDCDSSARYMYDYLQDHSLEDFYKEHKFICAFIKMKEHYSFEITEEQTKLAFSRFLREYEIRAKK